MTATRLSARYALQVTDNQCADSVGHSPGDDLLGCFVMSLVDFADMASLGSALLRPKLSPPAAAMPGSVAGLATQTLGPALGVLKVKAFLSS